MPAMPIALSRAPMVGMRQTSSETTTTMGAVAPGQVVTEGLEDDDDRQENDGEHGEQDRQRDLIWRPLSVGALDEGDHPVEEGATPLRRDAHDDAVREDLGPTGDRRTVATGLPDNGGRLAGDRRLVDGGHALGDLSVGGNEVPRLAHHHVALGQLGGGHQLLAAVRTQPACSVSDRMRRSVSACALPLPRPSPRRSWQRSP